jgi:hypothetical protein
MNRCSRSRLWAVGFLVVVGCSKPTEPKSEAEREAATVLKLFGAGYQFYLEDNQRPPRNLDDLKAVISSDEPIDFDRYHIIWGVDLKSITQDRTVLAYDAVVPEKGGMVLFHDGKVQRVSAEEFAKLPKAVAAKPLEERPADVTFTPTEYYAEFNKLNENRIDKMGPKYEGKVIELKGIVKGLGPLSGRPELLVISPGKEQEDVRCFMPEGEEFWAKLSKGQEVTVRGLMRQPQSNPMLTNCWIASSGPYTGVTITAEELAREFAADRTKAAAKYAGKSFILTGEVVSGSAWSTFRGVNLKGTADQPVECVFQSDTERDKKFVTGAKLKLYAEYNDTGTRLINCELISK